MGNPVAYLRKSRVFADRPGAVSHAQQLDAIRTLAERHGYDLQDHQIVEDWGRSGGRGKERHRPAYLALRRAVEDGAVTDIFAYDQSRLTRSTVEWAELAAACRDRGVAVHLFSGGTKDFATADGRMTAGILAQVAEGERERAVERAKDAIARRRARGELVGPPAYGRPVVRKDGSVVGANEDPAAVVAAFRERGTFRGAAVLLNERGVPPKRAAFWRAEAVRRVIKREAPQLIPVGTRKGAKTRQNFLFAGLLRCGGTVTRPGATEPETCGGIMTAVNRPGRPSPLYRCQRAWTDGTHSRPMSVSEHSILPWLKAEAAHLVLPGDQVQRAERNLEQRARLTEERRRLGLAFARQAIDEPTWTAEDTAIQVQLHELDAAERLQGIVQAVDWTWNPAKLNAVLRAMWTEVHMGHDQRPVRATWTMPHWRG